MNLSVPRPKIDCRTMPMGSKLKTAQRNAMMSMAHIHGLNSMGLCACTVGLLCLVF